MASTTRRSIVAVTACAVLAAGGLPAATADAASAHPSHYVAARTAWKHGAKVSAAQEGRYWHVAAQDLAKSGRRYALYVRRLRTLQKLPDTGLSHAQITLERRDTKSLNHFFGTPGLYL